MNIICTSVRNRFTVKRISNLMFMKLHGPPMNSWNPEKYAKSWLRPHRTADDQRVRKSKIEETYSELDKEQATAKQIIWGLL